ncbi:MAG: hypothetical protein IKR25_03365, partial [Muribaculaceae bacterium]|nr:hypothetical protein [Muribaculaceae bacterium]
ASAISRIMMRLYMTPPLSCRAAACEAGGFICASPVRTCALASSFLASYGASAISRIMMRLYMTPPLYCRAAACMQRLVASFAPAQCGRKSYKPHHGAALQDSGIGAAMYC